MLLLYQDFSLSDQLFYDELLIYVHVIYPIFLNFKSFISYEIHKAISLPKSYDDVILMSGSFLKYFRDVKDI
jgi:hypothetical protein